MKKKKFRKRDRKILFNSLKEKYESIKKELDNYKSGNKNNAITELMALGVVKHDVKIPNDVFIRNNKIILKYIEVNEEETNIQEVEL